MLPEPHKSSTAHLTSFNLKLTINSVKHACRVKSGNMKVGDAIVVVLLTLYCELIIEYAKFDSHQERLF